MQPRIANVWPGAAIPGGVVQLSGEGFVRDSYTEPTVRVGVRRANVLAASQRLVLAEIPEKASQAWMSVETPLGHSERFPLLLAERLASDVHPVANPVIDSKGNIFTTFSGGRGKQVPVSIFKIQAEDGEVVPFLSGIVNATGLAVLDDDTLLVSSRQDGTVYAVSPDAEIEVFAQGMGVATGLAVDSEQNVYVGDRTGTIFKIDRFRQIFVYATLDPSVAAFHLAFRESNGLLYATAPSTSSCETIQRIDQNGQVERHWQCFGRPQGLAIDSADRIFVCASRYGRRGISRLTGGVTRDDAEVLDQVVSGSDIVGIAFAPDDSMIIATGSSIHRLPPLD